MSQQVLYAIIKNRALLEQLIHDLQKAGISPGAISFLSPTSEFPELKEKRNWRIEERVKKAQSAETHTKASEGATAGVVTGSFIGGVLGLLAGFGAFIIPGLGPFLAAGPLLGTLSGIGVGGTLGGIFGGLIGNTLPEHDIEYYEKKLKEGGILITLNVPTEKIAKIVRDLLLRYAYEDSISSVEVTKKGY